MNQIAATKEPEEASEKTNEAVSYEEEEPMEQESVIPATVFCIRLRQPKSNLLYKMSVPEICRNFRYLCTAVLQDSFHGLNFTVGVGFE